MAIYSARNCAWDASLGPACKGPFAPAGMKGPRRQPSVRGFCCCAATAAATTAEPKEAHDWDAASEDWTGASRDAVEEERLQDALVTLSEAPRPEHAALWLGGGLKRAAAASLAEEASENSVVSELLERELEGDSSLPVPLQRRGLKATPLAAYRAPEGLFQKQQRHASLLQRLALAEKIAAEAPRSGYGRGEALLPRDKRLQLVAREAGRQQRGRRPLTAAERDADVYLDETAVACAALSDARAMGAALLACSLFVPSQRRGPLHGMAVTKICDIDSLRAADLNRGFMLLLVQQLPAEVVLQLLTRIGLYRDRPCQKAYEALSRDFSQVVSRCLEQQRTPAAGAAAAAATAAALLTRSIQTLPLPWAVDYVRRFGAFSKAFLARHIERVTNPRFFDFVRYQQHGGLRPLPAIVRHPYRLSSYVQLLGECSVKKYLYTHLKRHGVLPPQQLLQQQSARRGRRREEEVPRPPVYDLILAAEHMGVDYTELIKSQTFPLSTHRQVRCEVSRAAVAAGAAYAVSQEEGWKALPSGPEASRPWGPRRRHRPHAILRERRRRREAASLALREQLLGRLPTQQEEASAASAAAATVSAAAAAAAATFYRRVAAASAAGAAAISIGSQGPQDRPQPKPHHLIEHAQSAEGAAGAVATCDCRRGGQTFYCRATDGEAKDIPTRSKGFLFAHLDRAWTLISEDANCLWTAYCTVSGYWTPPCEATDASSARFRTKEKQQRRRSAVPCSEQASGGVFEAHGRLNRQGPAAWPTACVRCCSRRCRCGVGCASAEFELTAWRRPPVARLKGQQACHCDRREQNQQSRQFL
ncbi:uncharacterized protein LOC34621760 [Cyclospora cayetanensis]|uniref:Uncharacterized protein LOC34621760 n=1 Tax=Cyclospora cayetanensis TaxID=88456 RepID=A0A6P6RVI5_9EIME|nr:uncharacterized protein LOC34621760 [Cyclospora cayetanensis]